MEYANSLHRLVGKTSLTLVKILSHRTAGGFLRSIMILLLIGVPYIARADDIGSLRDILRFFQRILSILDILLPIVVTLAALVFFWGMVKFIWGGADTKTREDGKGLMIWGIIALFVMISVWGLVGVISNLFGVDQNATITVPKVPNGGGGNNGGGSI